LLNNLNFLNPGQPWPPKSEYERLKRYDNNRKLFQNKHTEVYEDQFKRIERVIGNFGEVVSYQVIVNYQKLISIKVADLLFGEAPKIKCGDNNSTEQETIDTIEKRSELINTAYKIAIDVSRYGDGLIYVYRDNKGGKIGYTQPPLWLPVTNYASGEIINHVIAYTSNEGQNLTVQIHFKGYYEQREYTLDTGINTTIKSLVSSNNIQTGLDDFAVIQVPNIQTTDSIFGMDDYTDIDSIISEIIVRLSQISRVLDKHAAPSVQGPSMALEQDPTTGEWKLKMGNYFPRDTQDDPSVEYITWDGQLASSFQMIEKLTNILYVVSEMGPTLLGDTENAGGQATSGTAFKLRMISPLAKVRRIAMRFTPALEKALRLCSQLGGEGIKNLKDAEISIQWRDGLPNDELETANIMNTRTGGKATISQKRAIELINDMTEEQAEEELQQILDEESALNPLTPPPMSGENEPKKDDIEGDLE
jgi:hypothetical protein